MRLLWMLSNWMSGHHISHVRCVHTRTTESLYDVLGVDFKASSAEIKTGL
jgi:hypothetical protein